jgi:hypothetical protein
LTARRDQVCAGNDPLALGMADGTGCAAGRRSERPYSAAIVCGLKSMPIAFATPAPYSGSAL